MPLLNWSKTDSMLLLGIRRAARDPPQHLAEQVIIGVFL
jgi:hypothetical protein